jgi:aminopeptidase N
MSWWNTLWLNEGFARYCESWAVDVLFPDWGVLEQFVSEVFGAAQAMDALESSHPVEVQVATPEEINEIFDPISYNKGASLIRMLLELIGASAFRRGLQIYLAKFAYKNTESNDLWDCFTAAVREEGKDTDIHAIMARWCTAIGYPVLAVSEQQAAEVKGKGCRCFVVSQAKYLQSGKGEASKVIAAVSEGAVVPAGSSVSVAGEEADVWSVPLSIGSYSLDASRGVAITHRILERLQGLQLVQVDMPEDKDAAVVPVSFNYASSGFYRLHYSPSLFSSLSSLIARGSLPVLDRLALLRDCYALSACGLGYSVADLLDLVVLFRGTERNYTVLSFLGIVLAQLCSLHADAPEVLAALQRLVAAIFLPRWQELGWSPKQGADGTLTKEHHLTYLERALLLHMLGNYAGEAGGAGELAERSFALLESALREAKGVAAIHPDLRAPVFALAIRARGQQARELLLTVYRNPSTSNEEKVRVLTALGTTRRCNGKESAAASSSSAKALEAENRGDLEKLLEWVLNSGEVRTGDLLYVLSSIGQDGVLARRLCWRYMQSHWDSLLSKFKGAMFVLGRIFPAVLGEMQTESEASEFEAWFATHPALGAERSVKQSAETVRAREERTKRERPIVARWVQQHAKQL